MFCLYLNQSIYSSQHIITMEEITKNLQTIQINHNQFINQHKKLTDKEIGKHEIEYKPNESNSTGNELRKAETHFDWLKDNVELTEETIQKTIIYLESLVIQKEKVESELNQLKLKLEEVSRKKTEVGEKIVELKQKEVEEEMKKLSEGYDKQLNEIKKEIMKPDEFKKMIELQEFVFYHERKQIEEWCGKKCGEILFDSNKDNWSVNTSVFDSKIINKSNLVFVVEDTNNNKFGYYLPTKVDKIYSDSKSNIKSKQSFMFTLKSNGRVNGMYKFEEKDSCEGLRIFDKTFNGYLFGTYQGFWIHKENNKTQSIIYENSTLFDFHGITKAFHPNLSEGRCVSFTPKRFIIIQMI